MLKYCIAFQNFTQPTSMVGRDLESYKKWLRYISEIAAYK